MNEDLATKLSEVMRLVVLANQQTERAVFVGFSGHVNAANFMICAGKEDFNKSLFSEQVHFKYEGWSKLDQWIDRLNDLLNEGIPAEPVPSTTGEGRELN